MARNQDLRNFVEKLKKLDQFVRSESDRIIQLNEPDMEAANRSQLENLGQDINGRRSLGRYAASTAAQKRRKGQRTDHITLKDSGTFHESIDLIKTRSDTYAFISNDPKFAGPPVNLKAKFGDVLGLNRQNFERFRLIWFESVTRQITRFLSA